MKLHFLVACAVVARCSDSLPEKMRAALMSSRSWDFQFHVDKLVVSDVDVPKPGEGEVLVEVHASNINPVDHKIVQMAGLLWQYPHKLGFDLAGVVAAVGPGVQRLKVGDEVWGEATNLAGAAFPSGTFAEYAAIPESVLGVKPKSLSMLDAGAMPMVALTGYEALTWAAGGPRFTKDNVTVLVLGGSGGTGHMGIQLAKALGAKQVITTCSSSHVDFVRSIGADRVIDYHKENYYDVLPAMSVDFVYDCVGQSGTGDHAYPLLTTQGHFATLLPSGLPSISSQLSRRDVRWYAPTCVGGCSHYDRIDAVAALAEQGKLKVHIDTTFGLEDIAKAFNMSIDGHTSGKVSIRVAKERKQLKIPEVMI